MIGEYIVDILDQVACVHNSGDVDNNSNGTDKLNEVIMHLKHKVKLLCQQFSLYDGMSTD